jgi:S1-C subfamily serine protease
VTRAGRYRRRGWPGCVAIAVISVSACSADEGAGSDATQPATAPADAAAVLAADSLLARERSVFIEAEGCGLQPQRGGGAFVADNVVVTVAHVVAGSKSLIITLPDGSSAAGALVAIDRDKDLALLSVDAPGVEPLPISTMPKGSVGAFTVRRDEQAVVFSAEAVSFVDIEMQGIDTQKVITSRRGYQLVADVKQGDSGSVVVSGGMATAVIFATSTQSGGRSWATDVTEAEPLLEGLSTKAIDTGECA